MFGVILGQSSGAIFTNRLHLSKVGLHRPPEAGICATEAKGAESIVLNGGYEDGEDYGEHIIYTGHGGRDSAGNQIADQEFKRGNKGLALNVASGIPVRVMRGPKAGYNPPVQGFRYDGLYRVERYEAGTGLSGFRIYRYWLTRSEEEPASEGPSADGSPSARAGSWVTRVIRDSRITQEVKKLHSFVCQVCGERLSGPAGPYAEAAHIKPLGSPHYGPDTQTNLLCLCPNHHVLFDHWAFTIAEDYRLVGLEGRLRTVKEHSINAEYLRYHAKHYHAAQGS